MPEMPRRYLRVNEAAELLGVAPVTVRWYAAQGKLPVYRVGRGIGHRRFRYADVEHLALTLDRVIESEWPWDRSIPVTRQMAAQYLGLSSRYLSEEGHWPSGETRSFAELEALEVVIYKEPQREGRAPGKKEEDMWDTQGMGMHHRHGHGRGGCPGRGWMRSETLEEADSLTLRSMKRHLEAAKADIEDRLAEIGKRIHTPEED